MKLDFKVVYFFVLLYLLIVVLLSEFNIIPTVVSLILYGIYFPLAFFL